MNRIRFLRLMKGMKQAELANKILVSQSSLSGYESGKFEPDSKTLLKIADFFQVSVDYLLGRDCAVSPEDPSIRKIPVYNHLRNNLQENTPLFLYYQQMKPGNMEPGEYFGLFMQDDNMEPRICAGDLIIVRKQSEIPDGSIAVAKIGEHETAVRKIYQLASGEILLISYNAKYEPSCYTAEQVTSLPVRILGRVVEFQGSVK